jgi:hypothetical protein
MNCLFEEYENEMMAMFKYINFYFVFFHVAGRPERHTVCDRCIYRDCICLKVYFKFLTEGEKNG